MSGKKQKSKNRRKQLRRQRHRSVPGSLQRQLADLDDLWEDGELEEAEYEERLESLARRFPRQMEVLLRLVEHYQSQADYVKLEKVLRQIVEIRPDEPDFWLMLGGAQLFNLRPALAMRSFETVLARRPSHEQAAELQRTIATTRSMIDEQFGELEPNAERRRELALLHDQVHAALNEGRLTSVIEQAMQLLERWPTFKPALNNLCEAHFRMGRVDLAISNARRVLELDPNNYHALGNLARYQLLSGQPEAAAATAELLKQIHDPSSADLPTKKAETLAFLGNWQAVLDTFQTSGNNDRPDDQGKALMFHFAAVAAANLGREIEARSYWQSALKTAPSLRWAAENLEDLDLPVGERNGPWAFPIDYWLPKSTVECLMKHTNVGMRRNDAGMEREMRKFLSEHPEMVRLAPHMLERGDVNCQFCVVGLAKIANSPELFESLREFAFGRRGSDAMRMDAIYTLTRAGIIESGPVQVWLGGKQTEAFSMGHEITPEPTQQLSKKIEPLVSKARDALNESDGILAAELLQQAAELEPENLPVQYNLALAYEFQGRHDDAVSRIRQIYQQHPEYLFARVFIAKCAADEGRYEEARELLLPLMKRPKLHASEFGALAEAFIHILWKEGRRDGAKHWLAMWKEVADEDDWRIEHWERRLNRRGLLGKLFR